MVSELPNNKASNLNNRMKPAFNGRASDLMFFCCVDFPFNIGRAEMECDGTRKRTGGEVKGKKANGGGSQQSCTVSDTVYPALLPLMRSPRLPAAD